MTIIRRLKLEVPAKNGSVTVQIANNDPNDIKIEQSPDTVYLEGPDELRLVRDALTEFLDHMEQNG